MAPALNFLAAVTVVGDVDYICNWLGNKKLGFKQAMTASKEELFHVSHSGFSRLRIVGPYCGWTGGCGAAKDEFFMKRFSCALQFSARRALFCLQKGPW